MNTNSINLPDFPDILEDPPQWLFDILDEPEAARDIKSTPASLKTMRHRGTGPAFFKLGSKVLYVRRDLYEWLLAGGKRRSTRAAA